ncbi:MAG: hypothetical protein J1E64_05320 [Acetatifactor sp.]|nr:hypothetical protein [Acetatifactor sp.]
MKRKLLLDNRKQGGYPEAFRKAIMIVPTGEKQLYFEKSIIKALNEFHPKLHIAAVEYGDIKGQFPRTKVGITSGVIVEDVEIDTSSVRRFREKEYYIYTEGEGMFARRIFAYVYMPLPSSEERSEGRNTMISQTLFPTLIDYMEEYLDSPCYTATNHPVYVINASQPGITAATIRENIASLAFVDIAYVDVFRELHRHKIDLKSVPRDLKLFLEKYDAQFKDCYDRNEDRFENPYMSIDFTKKEFRVRQTGILEKLKLQGGKYNFNGSGEKFYWMMIYPMTIAAYDQGYRVDISEYRDFCEQYRDQFTANSDKMRRCEILLRYLEKYIGQ